MWKGTGVEGATRLSKLVEVQTAHAGFTWHDGSGVKGKADLTLTGLHLQD